MTEAGALRRLETLCALFYLAPSPSVEDDFVMDECLCEAFVIDKARLDEFLHDAGLLLVGQSPFAHFVQQFAL